MLYAMFFENLDSSFIYLFIYLFISGHNLDSDGSLTYLILGCIALYST
jgi:hypothetical protein